MLRNDDDMTRHLLLQEDSDEDDDMGAFVNEAETEPSDLQYYIRDRLAQQGFTKAQARAAFLAVAKPNNQGVSTNNLESFEFTFDECLQWLCIHLDEDQLPEKFDPRGRTLDVLAPTKPTGIKTTLASSSSFSPVPVAQINGDMLDKNMVDFANHEGKIDGQSELEVQTLAAQYGIDPEEAKLILEQASTQQQSPPVDNLMSFEQVLWDTLCRAAASLGGGVSVGNNDQDFAGYDASAQQQMLDDELEAIAAIFPDENECRIEHQDEDRLVVQLRHSALNDNEVFLVKVVVVKSPSAHGRKLPYPWVPPNRVLISRLDGIANSSSPSTRWYHQGAFVHVRLIQFMQSLPRGEPMLFEIFGHIQKLIQDANSGELKSVSLRPFLKCTEASTVDNQLGEQVQIANVNLSTSVAAVESKLPLSAPLQKKALPRRPRDRSFFWSTPPYKTPPAVAFPTISREMQTARGSLPAAMARSNFFGMMKAADQVIERGISIAIYISLPTQSCLRFACQGGRVVLVTGDTG
jgi:ATP-dependent RNA helicase DHX57